MSFIAVDEDGDEYIYDTLPRRGPGLWDMSFHINVPKGTSLKLIGKQLTWLDEPIELE
jgi:hypothetical protein